MRHEVRIRVLAASDVVTMRKMLHLFGTAFEDMPTYTSRPPEDDYLAELLASRDFIAIAATRKNEVVGGLAAYVLRKFEQARAEVYIYDLAVDESARRQGVATALIREVQKEAGARGAYVVFVQADLGDDPAIALYSKLGTREDVLHFDIEVTNARNTRRRDDA